MLDHGTRKRMGDIVKFGVIDPNGEIHEIQLSSKKRGQRRTITAMYGPSWIAVPMTTYETLVSDRELKLSDVRVLFFMLSQVEHGNHIRLRISDVARHMDMRPAHVSRSIKALKEHNILIDRVPFGFRLHPEFGWRGDPTDKVHKTVAGSLELTT
jgi:hypothetical protein